MEDEVPIKGFVYRRKQFFSSFENLLDTAEKDPSGGSSNLSAAAISSAKDKKWRLSNADISFQQKVVTFEQYSKQPERKRQDSTTSNVSVDLSVTGPEDFKESGDNSSSNIEKWSSLPRLDDQVSFTTELNSSTASSNESTSIGQKKDINGNTSVSVTKPNSSIVTNVQNTSLGVDTTVEENGKQQDVRENKPHWTIVFSQRLNQIRYRFESKSKSDFQKSFSIGPKRNNCRRSMDNLDTIEKPVLNPSLTSSKELAKSCVNLYDSKLTSQNAFKRNVVQTSSSTKYKQTQTWLEKNLVLVTKENADTVSKENAKNMAKETSTNIAKVKKNLKIAASRRPNLTDSEKAELASNAYLAKWGPNGSLDPDIIQHENNGILFSNQIFAGQIKEPIRKKEDVVEESQDVVKEVKIIEKVNGHDDVKISAVPPVLVPSEGFTSDEKVKERTTLKDWDPVSCTF